MPDTRLPIRTGHCVGILWIERLHRKTPSSIIMDSTDPKSTMRDSPGAARNACRMDAPCPGRANCTPEVLTVPRLNRVRAVVEP